MRFLVSNLFSDFHSGGMDKKEFEEMLKEAVKKEDPSATIKNIKYLKHGVEIILDGGNIIEIEVDWNEIIIS